GALPRAHRLRTTAHRRAHGNRGGRGGDRIPRRARRCVRMSTQPALVLDSIEKSFGRRRVVRAATVHVHAGRITALLGRNGCGKTTLLRIAAGEIARDGGCIDFLGRTVARPRLHQLAPAGLFYLPERGLLTGSATAG